MSEEHGGHWGEKAAWMRSVQATEAAWSPDGALVLLKLGPEISQPIEQPKPTDDEQRDTAERNWAEKRRVLMGAVGGFRKR